MKTFKILSIALISISLLTLQGCVTMTGEADPANTTYVSEQQVSPDHKLYKGVKVGEVDGFAGTSVLVIPPFITGAISRVRQAAIATFCFGVIPPNAMLGRSWLYVQSQRVANSWTSPIDSNR